MMNKYNDLAHVLVPTNFPLELIATPENAAYLAELYNDEMANLVAKHPTKLIAAVASIPLNNIDAALKEIDRAINVLGFRGILMHSPVYNQSVETRRGLDSKDLLPIYAKMEELDFPIWLHPRTDVAIADYPGEPNSLYGVNQVLGWPYETSVAMTRLVFSGIMDMYPNLKFITHHCGAMIPYMADRINSSYEYWKITGAEFMQHMTQPPVQYFNRFYNDTALYGNTPALMCAYAFFRVDHMLFGTDYPFDAERGDKFTRDTITAVDGMIISDSDKAKIFSENAIRLLKLSR